MNVWMVRGGKFGEFEPVAFEKSLACLGFFEMPNLTKAKTEATMRELVEKAYPAASTSRVSNFSAQVYSFAQRMQVGDIIAMPLKGQSQIALARIAGPYEYRTDLRSDSPCP